MTDDRDMMTALLFVQGKTLMQAHHSMDRLGCQDQFITNIKIGAI
jgi:hypothetical protein